MALVTPALQAALGEVHPDCAVVAGYHLGWLEPDGSPASTDHGGKALRPALALLSAAAAGEPETTGLPGAVAVELVHAFSLLHDDVMDGDDLRHHRPAAWTVFGANQAILAGDDLLVLAVRQVLAAPPHGERAARALLDRARQLIAGQADDLAFERRSAVTPAECLAMAAGKTGALFACSASIGALLAGAGPVLVDRLAEYGMHTGLAFQAVDDLLGIWGRPEVTGKPARSDLRRRKKTLPVSLALAHDTPGTLRLRELLTPDGVAPAELDEPEELELAAKLVAEEGGLEGTRTLIAAELAAALDCLGGAAVAGTLVDPAVWGELEAVTQYVAGRER